MRIRNTSRVNDFIKKNKKNLFSEKILWYRRLLCNINDITLFHFQTNKRSQSNKTVHQTYFNSGQIYDSSLLNKSEELTS